ncbi:hypothetical protein LB507_004840 [Fusarium sp. FIESC RH6]|nr:hypothetical protein LB507_004840 [Fusarium sp. FIESC RH6]
MLPEPSITNPCARVSPGSKPQPRARRQAFTFSAIMHALLHVGVYAATVTLRPEPFEGLYPVLLPQSFIIAPPKGLQASRLLIPAAQPKQKLRYGLYCTYGPGSRFPRKRPTEQRCP